MLDDGTSVASAQPDPTVAAIAGVNYKVRVACLYKRCITAARGANCDAQRLPKMMRSRLD